MIFRLSAVLLVWLASAGPASAVIKKLTPLKEVIDSAPVIVAAEVARVDADRPAAVFTVKAHLKGTCEFDTLPVNLTGDSHAKKDDHTKALLARLSPARRLVLFLTREGRTHTVFGFLEGTWFQVQGTTDADGKTVRWAFLHCEPYFRRTFKGSTAELVTTIENALSGKATPPAPDEKEPPGFGPLPEKSGRADDANKSWRAVRVSGPVVSPSHERDRVIGRFHRPADAGRSPSLYAVIPTVVFVGPLAILAALFPGVFARLAVGLVTWRAFLVVASVTSTLALAYYWLRGYLPDNRLLGPTAFSGFLTIVTIVGMVWAARRYRRLAVIGPEVTAPPTRTELLVMLGLTAGTAILLAGTGWFVGWSALVELPWREFTVLGVGLAAGTAYMIYRSASAGLDPGPADRPRLSLSAETVALAGTVAFGLGLLAVRSEAMRPARLAGETNEIASDAVGPKLADVRVFTLDDATEVLSGVVLGPDGRLYAGGSKETALSGFGRVFCLDPTTGREVWRFTNDGDLKPVYCTPAVTDGRVYVGEGLHTDADRRLFALNAATGQPLWQVPTTSHTEGTPAVAGDRLVFSAGDDGLMCVSAADGQLRWHLDGLKRRLHIDTPPTVAGGRVYFGSGYYTLALLCADLDTGTEVWRSPQRLRSFGKPLVRGERAYAGLGTGNLVEDLSTEPEDGVPAETAPAGAVVCLDARTGAELWRRELPKSVHTGLAADPRSVFAACKDGSVYALDRKTGAVRWRRAVGESFAAGPAVTPVAVYAVTREGRAAALDPLTGEPFWFRDVAEQLGKGLSVFSTPLVVSSADGRSRAVYFGAATENRNNGAKAAAVVRIDDVSDE